MVILSFLKNIAVKVNALGVAAAARARSLIAQQRQVVQAMFLIREAAGRWTVAWVALLIIQGLLPVPVVYLLRSLVDTLVSTLRTGVTSANGRVLFGLVAGMAALALLTEALRGATSWVRTVQSELLTADIHARLHQQSMAVDLAFYDSAESYDRLHRAREEAAYRPLSLLESLGGLLQNTLTLAAMGTVLASFGFWLPFALLLSTAPALLAVCRSTMDEHEWRTRRTEDMRRAVYYDWLLSSGESAAELRAFGLGDHFQSAYKELRRRLANDRVRLAGRRCVTEMGAGAAGLLLSGGALAWMVWKALRGAVGLGDLALFYQAFNQGQRLMRALLSDLGQVYTNTLFLHDVFEFLSLKPHVVDPAHAVRAPQTLRAGITFRHVDFRYPGQKSAVLDDFCLHVPAGQVAAIVGANGEGKSTLIKLLCRLYDPQTGKIEFDGLDIRDMRIDDVRRLIAVVFQNPIRYNATVAENIIVGDLSVPRSTALLTAAARGAAAEQCFTGLPSGYNTKLGKWFTGGLELSGGQWQRVALARSFWRDAPIIALDEPTTGMDPWTESDWLARFRKVAGGRTALIMTHRFNIAMRADCIHMMADGRIVESGSHLELLAAGGRYAEWWRCQAPGCLSEENIEAFAPDMDALLSVTADLDPRR